MNTDEQHDFSYEDTGETDSVLAHIAYADWRGPDYGESTAPDHERCTHALGQFLCVLPTRHTGGHYLRARQRGTTHETH